MAQARGGEGMGRWTARDYRKAIGWVVFSAGGILVLRFLPWWLWVVLAGGLTMWTGVVLIRGR